MGSRFAAVLSSSLLLAVPGCVLIGEEKDLGGDGTSPLEKRASRLVSEYAGEPFECKHTGAIEVELRPEYEQSNNCYNAAGEFRNAMVSPDGVLLSVTRAVRLKSADS